MSCEAEPRLIGQYENCTHFPDQCPTEKIFFEAFYQNFRSIHKWLCSFLCFTGILLNGVTMLVLTRPPMRSVPNFILTLIAGCDFALMISYLIYLIRAQLISFDYCPADEFSYSWTIFMLIHANLSVLSKATSIWLSVLLAAYRYCLLKSTDRIAAYTASYSGFHGNIRFTIFALLACILLMSSPIFVNHDIDSKPVPEHELRQCPNGTIYYELKVHRISMAYDCFLFKFNFWTVGLLFKVVPCFALAYFLSQIVIFIIRQDERRAKRFRSQKIAEFRRTTQRTTKLLMLILSSTLICELPCAVASVWAALGQNFNFFVYRNLGDFFETLSLLNGLVTFPLYCFMSSGFRQTCANFFRRQPLTIQLTTRLSTHDNRNGLTEIK